MYDTIEESDCISFLTEWDEFKQINWKDVKDLLKDLYLLQMEETFLTLKA